MKEDKRVNTKQITSICEISFTVRYTRFNIIKGKEIPKHKIEIKSMVSAFNCNIFIILYFNIKTLATLEPKDRGVIYVFLPVRNGSPAAVFAAFVQVPHLTKFLLFDIVHALNPPARPKGVCRIFSISAIIYSLWRNAHASSLMAVIFTSNCVILAYTTCSYLISLILFSSL